MFFELTKKYRSSGAVEIRQKKYKGSSPSEDTPEVPEEEADPNTANEAPNFEAPNDEPAKATKDDSPADIDDSFDIELRELESQKKAAKEKEDFDLAAELKVKIVDMTRTEVQRLRAEKTEAVKVEDYLKAKDLKIRITKLDPKNEL